MIIMTELIACLSTGKGTWAQITDLIESEEWERVFLITNEFGKENFSTKENVELLVIDQNKEIQELIDEIMNKLKEKITGTEVAINFISGTGKEHMALFSAIMKLGVGIRVVTSDNRIMKEL